MIKHIYNYSTHAEKRYFLGDMHRELYDKVAIKGNIVSFSPTGVAGFLATANSPYYIDPQTYIFQHATIQLKRKGDLEKGEEEYVIKPSIKDLAENQLGGPFKRVIQEDRPILPSDFYKEDGSMNNTTINEICEGAINIQKNTLQESLGEDEKEFMDDNESILPEFVIAPYFYLTARSIEKWLKITIECYKATKEIEKELEVFFALVVSKEAFYKNGEKIVAEIANIKPSGILLWIDEHEEENLTQDEILKFIELLKKLKENSEKIYNSYGGFLSILLGHKEFSGGLLQGVAHGINYGEYRSVMPVGGGLPMARFYFPKIHSRLRWADSLYIINKKHWLDSTDLYKKNVCSCKQCAELIKEQGNLKNAFDKYGESKTGERKHFSGTIINLEFPTADAKRIASNHYLFNKAREFDLINKKPITDFLEDFNRTYNDIAPVIGDELVGHLYNWRKAIESYLKHR